MILGRIDDVDGHYVGTKFFLAVLPIECVYVTHRTRRATSSGGRIRIPTYWRSVVLAYGRVWLPAFAFVLLALGVRHVAMWIASGVLLALSAAAYRAGALPDEEKSRLRLLGSVTGLRIDPARLEPVLRETKRDSLGDLMEKGGIPITADGILAVLDDIPVPAMPLVYGYACYAGDDAIWRACADVVYSRCEREG